MSIGINRNLNVIRGKSFHHIISWGVSPIEYREITDISSTAPVRIVAPGHGVTTLWPFAIRGAKGLTVLNAKSNPPELGDYVTGEVIDPDTIEINEISTAGLAAYTGGGILQYATKPDLVGCTAELQARKKPGSELLLRLTSSLDGGILLDDATGQLHIYMTPEQTEVLSLKPMQYELEVRTPPATYFPAGNGYQLLRGLLLVSDEIVVAVP